VVDRPDPDAGRRLAAEAGDGDCLAGVSPAGKAATAAAEAVVDDLVDIELRRFAGRGLGRERAHPFGEKRPVGVCREAHLAVDVPRRPHLVQGIDPLRHSETSLHTGQTLPAVGEVVHLRQRPGHARK
jgi:hypothetical protein